MYAEDIERWITEKFKDPERAKLALGQLSASEAGPFKERIIRCILSLSESDYDSVDAWAKKAEKDPEYIIWLAEHDNRGERKYNFHHGLYSQES